MDNNKSRKFLANMSIEKRAILAGKVGCVSHYLYMIGQGDRMPTRDISIRIEIESHGRYKERDFYKEIKDNIE